MNSITIYKRQNKPKVWSRVIFHISRCTGKIKRNFNPDVLYGKLEQEDVDIVMALIEKEAGNFKFLRFFYKLEIIVVILMFSSFVLLLIFFFVLNNSLYGFFLVFIFILLVIFYFGFVNSCIHKIRKITIKKLYPIIDNINRKLFNMRGLYLMINQNLNYVNIYIIPAYIEANVLLKNIIYDSQSSESRTKSQNDKCNENDNNNILNLKNTVNITNNKTEDILTPNNVINGLGLLLNK
jgi:hypothetical protein